MPFAIRVVLPFVFLATGCLSVTHPARVRPGTSVDLLVAPERQEQRIGDSPVGSLRAQVSGGYGFALAPRSALYVGGIVGVVADDELHEPAMPYAAADVYLQAYGGEDATLDLGAGVLLSYYPGAYALAGKAIGRHVRVDGGVRALFGFDTIEADPEHGDFDPAGPLRDVTPHLVLSARVGGVRVAAYGEYAVYRLMDRAEIRQGNEGDDTLVATTGGFAAGLLVGTPF